jgi:ATP-dependent exoDNAse (exonuclease V) beta subunit
MTKPTFEPSEIIQALAGSGKTQLLAYRFLRLMKLGADPTTILATTFSRKAAGEIRDRIVEMVSRAIVDSDSLAELIEGVPEIENGRDDCVLLLKQLVASLHRLKIGTIDSFFIKTALAFSDTLQMSQGWSILDEVNKDRVFEDAIARLTQDESGSARLAQILYLSKSGAKVAINKTIEGIQKNAFASVRDASGAWQWGHRREEMSEKELNDAIDSLLELQPEKESHAKALTKAIENIHNGNWKGFLTAGLAPKVTDGSHTYRAAKIEPEVIDALKPVIHHAFGITANTLIAKNKSTHELMEALHQFWLDAKHDQALYSFDDVTHFLSQMCEGGSGGVMHDLVELQYRLDGSIDHMLVDEFQDTSLPQWKVLWPLIDEIYQAQQDRSLFIVGDVKQSLYGFRGGEPALLRGLANTLEGAKEIRLNTSWRCSTPVLEAVNAVFEHVHESDLLTEHSVEAPAMWQQDFKTHVSAVPSRKGFAEIVTASDDPTRERKPLQLCIEKVVEVVTGILKKAPDAHIGILVRSNTKQQIQRIVHALRTCNEKVFAAEFGGNPLTDSPAVTVILSALLMADDACNSVSTFHVQTSPLGKHLGFDYSASPEEVKEISTKIHRRLLSDGYASVIQEFAEQLVEGVDERERLRLWQLVEFAELHAANMTLRPSQFVHQVKETQVPDPVSSQVQVMTIHKSKGLSFDSVVVCDLDQQLWKSPGLMQYHEKPCEPPVLVGMYAGDFIDEEIPEYAQMRMESHNTQVNEALCLLYVAMTRAKHSLHIVIPSKQGTKSHHKKLDGLLLQVLGEDQNQPPDTVVWKATSNNEDWIDDLSMGTASEPTKPITPFEVKPPSQMEDLIGGVGTASPSGLEGGGTIHVCDRFSGGVTTAMDWGTVVHKWFEDVEWLIDTPAVEVLLESVPREEAGRLGCDRLKQAAESCVKAFASSEIKALLTEPKGNVTVCREQDFAMRISSGTQFAEVTMKELSDIHGSIDRLVIHNDEEGTPICADVIDWKTDVFDQGELEEKISHYAPQLATYRLAAAMLLGLEVELVTAKLVFTKTGNVIDITEKAAVLPA